MGARDFDGVDDIITATVSAFTGAYTIGAWINPDSAGESSLGRICQLDAAGVEKTFLTLNASGALNLRQVCDGVQNVNIVSTAGPYWTAANWSVAFASYDGFGHGTTDFKIHYGTLSVPVAEVSYTGSSSGAAADPTYGTSLTIGNRAATDRTFDGRISRLFGVPWQMTRDEMEGFRQGHTGVLYVHGAPRFFYPLTSPTAAQAEDVSGATANGTVTGATAFDGPPVPLRLAA